MGESGEVLMVEGLDGEGRRVAGDERRILVGLHVHGGVGEVLDDFGEQLARNDGLAFFLHERRNRVLDGKFQVGGLERESVALRVEQDAGEDGKRRARRHAFEHDHECVLEFRLVDAEFQGWSLLRGSFDAGVPCRTGGFACTQARRRFTWLWRPMRAVCDAHRIRETIIQALRGNASHGSVFAQRRQEK